MTLTTTRTSLYVIENQYAELFDRLIIAADGLMNDEERAQLEADLLINEQEFTEKADAYAAVIRQKEARAEFLKSEAKRLQEAAKAELAQAEYLQTKISEAMRNRGLDKAETAHYRLSFRRSEAVELSVPADQLPGLYQRTELVYSADKAAIKTALKLGTQIPGAVLSVRQNLQIK